MKDGENFEDYFEFQILKAFTKAITSVIEEREFIVKFKPFFFNSNNEWPPCIIEELKRTLRPEKNSIL